MEGKFAFLSSALFSLVLGCFTLPQIAALADDFPSQSFKGYELYSIEPPPDKKEAKYSLLLGTNRNKFSQEVKAAAINSDQLVKRLNRLKWGQWVTWMCRDTEIAGLRVPSQDEVAVIKAICEKRGLHLQGPDISWVKNEKTKSRKDNR